MTNPLDTLDLLARTPGKLDKRQILRDHESPELKQLLTLALSPYINFGFATLPDSPLVPAGPRGEDDDIVLTSFFELAEKFRTRQLTGNNAQVALLGLLSVATEQQRLWFGRILTKDLRAGVDTAVNDVWPGTIPEFNVQLAEDWFKSTSTPKKAAKYGWFPKLVSPKLDGMRAIALHTGTGFGLFSREGRAITGMDHLLPVLDACLDRDWVYDGELYHHDLVRSKGFPYLIGLIKRPTWDVSGRSPKDRDRITAMLPDRDRIQYHLFDLVPRLDWDRSRPGAHQTERLTDLKHYLARHPVEALQWVEHRRVDDLETLQALNGKYLELGYEGSMIKDPGAPYMYTRTPAWLKYKQFQDGEFTITGTYEGAPGSKWRGSLGGLNLLTPDGQPFSCGGGRITEEYRQQLWINRDRLIGLKATVRFFELSPDGIPRFPVLICIRDYE